MRNFFGMICGLLESEIALVSDPNSEDSKEICFFLFFGDSLRVLLRKPSSEN